MNQHAGNHGNRRQNQLCTAKIGKVMPKIKIPFLGFGGHFGRHLGLKKCQAVYSRAAAWTLMPETSTM